MFRRGNNNNNNNDDGEEKKGNSARVPIRFTSTQPFCLVLNVNFHADITRAIEIKQWFADKKEKSCYVLILSTKVCRNKIKKRSINNKYFYLKLKSEDYVNLHLASPSFNFRYFFFFFFRI